MAPPKRPRTTAPAQQSTLTFNRTKPTANRIVKPHAVHPSKPPSLEPTTTPETQPIAVAPNDVPAPPTAEPEPSLSDNEEDSDEVEDEPDADDLRARRLPQKQINAYWAQKERERKAPRVHQRELSVREKILREFDMDSRYGPCIGISRLDRWKRARDVEREPPIEVLAVMLRAVDEEEKEGAKGGGRRKETTTTTTTTTTTGEWRRSVMDELIMSSRVAGEVSVDAS